MTIRPVSFAILGAAALTVAGCAQQAGSVYKPDTPMAQQEADAIACGATAYSLQHGVSLSSAKAGTFRACMIERGYIVRAG